MVHSNVNIRKISPIAWALCHIGIHKYADEDTRRYWRKVFKRNGGRKIKSLRTHRKGSHG